MNLLRVRTDEQHTSRTNKRKEKQFKLKRRWILGLPMLKSKRKFNEILKMWYFSESSFRKDDMFYKSVRSHVEGIFGGHCIERDCIPQDDIPNLKRLILSCLDNLTNRGLYLLAMIVSGGTVKSERTLGSLKKIIKDSLSSVLSSNNHDHHQLETRKQLFQLVTYPQHFRDIPELVLAFRSQFLHAAVTKVLRSLPDLPTQTLIAMRRKLKGVKAPMPQLQPRKQGLARENLIKQVRKISRELLLQLDEGNELQEPLAKAMAVVDLSQKLTTGVHKVFSEEFYQFSPEVRSSQNDILNAIWSVKKVVPVRVLRDLQLLVDSKATIPTRSLRGAFVNLLTEYLFACSDMDRAPKALKKILDVINNVSYSSTHNVSPHKYIENEIDCIFSVSVQTERIILGLLPDNEFDQDCADMNPLEDSDNDEDDDEGDSQLLEDKKFINRASSSMDLNYESENIEDFTPFEFYTAENILSGPFTSSERLNSDSEKLRPNNFDPVNLESKMHNTPCNNQCQGESTGRTFKASSVVSPDKRYDFYEPNTKIDPRDTTNFCEKTEPMPTKYNACKNQYLAIQDACDKTSMFAYNLIGHMLEELATTGGLDLDLSKKTCLGGEKQIQEAKGIGSMADQGLEGSQPVDLKKHSSGIVPTLQNVVSTVDLDCKLDLKSIELQACNVEYNPQRYPAVIMRIRATKATAFIFASGKMVCSGAQSEQQSKLAAWKCAIIIQKMGFPVKFKDFKILEIDASCDVKFPIRLESLANSHSAFSSFIPGKRLIYQMKQPKIHLYISDSGELILRGAKVRDDIYTAFENIYTMLTEFRKNQQWYGCSSIAATFFKWYCICASQITSLLLLCFLPSAVRL